MRVVILLGLLVRVAVAEEPSPSLPAPDLAKVEALYAQGTKHYDLGEYDRAIAAFKQAYRLMPDASFLFNLGQAYRQSRQCRNATDAYKAYLRNAPDDDRAKVEQFIAELATCAREEDEAAHRLLPPPRLSPRHRTMRWAGLAGLGVGLGLIGGGVVYSLRSLETARELERACVMTCSVAEYRTLDQRGRDQSRRGTVFYVSGTTIAAIGVGVALYTFVRPQRIVVEPTRDGAIAWARGTF